MIKQPTAEMTWTRAVLIGMAIVVGFFITQGVIPSRFIYWWGTQTQNVVSIIKSVTGHEIEIYTAVRIRDAIAMGYETFAFAIPLVGAYIWAERRRRRMGAQGAQEPKGYLSGK